MTHAAAGTRASELELAQRQLRAIEAFNRSRAIAVCAEDVVSQTRETRMDSQRRLDILKREHEALIYRAHAQLRESGQALADPVRLRAVVAHCDERFTDRVVTLLSEGGVRVVERVDNGADAIGFAIAEQPDLMFLEDGLLMVTGEDVVRQSRIYCAHTRIGVQVRSGDRVGVFLDAGADAVLSRALPVTEMANQLLSLVPRQR